MLWNPLSRVKHSVLIDDNNRLVTKCPGNPLFLGFYIYDVMMKKGVDDMQVNVLGTMYTIQESNKVDDPALEQCDGYCDNTTKMCVIDSMNCSDVMAKQNMKDYKNKVIRHELVHAFLYECGLAENSWANNEEIVDWIANMFPRMKAAFDEAESNMERG